MITRTFKLCLNAGTGSAPYINVNQYDKGETWLFELYTEQGERYMPTTGAIVGIKSDGHGIANTGTVDSNGRVVITETEQMTAAAGLAIFELSIDGLTHGTANFAVQVERKPGNNADLSDSDLSLIQEAIDSAEVIVEVIGDGDPSEVIGEHVDAWLDNHPEATTTVEDGAITAPKINQSLWDKLLVSEEASGNPASFEDGADDMPVSSLKVNLEPIQLGSGDPSPTNIRPIIAANGVNVWDEEWELGSFNASGQPTSAPNLIRCKNFIPVKAGETYRYVNESGTQQAPWYYDSSQNFVSRSSSYITNGNTFVIPSGVAYMKFALPATYGDTYKDDISFNYPSTYIVYRPYQGIAVDVEGKNLYQVTQTSQTIDGVTVAINADGTLNLAGTATATIALVLGYFTPKANKSYYISGSPFATSSCRLQFQEGSTTVANQYNNESVFVENLNVAQHRIRLYIANGTNVDGVTLKPMIRYASDTDDMFESYVAPTSYPISLGREVYGGTVDLATGVLTVTHGVADENSFTALATGLSGGGLHWAEYTTPDITINGYALSNMVTRKDGVTGWASTTPCFAITDLSRLRVYCAESTLADFKSAYSGLQIIYPLATPTTVQLTPQEVKTLLGYNNISSTGTVDVIYHADTKLYVDKMTAVDNAIIAPTEADFVTTRNYTVNDLVIVNDTLYKVTANIASGSAITPNSNVQQTTLGALIKALS